MLHRQPVNGNRPPSIAATLLFPMPPSAARSRARYLSLLARLPQSSSSSLVLVDGQHLPHLTLRAVRPDSSALLVAHLPTPLGTLPAAVVRAADVVALTAVFARPPARATPTTHP